MSQSGDPLLSLTGQIVIAHIENNATPTHALPGLIRDVYLALATARSTALSTGSSTSPGPAAGRGQRADRAVFGDHLVCLECGLRMKMLKRHLQTVHDMTPARYRMKHLLPGDYPMVARDYAALRSSLAKASGLGKRPGSHNR